jgi:DNA/RNA endonuclease G (NUC1)
MSGYDPNFTGVEIPLPTFGEKLEPQILKKDSFGDKAWRKYIHYSVATNMSKRAPACVALNIDQKLLKPGQERDLKWMVDKEIGDEYQLDNDYYRKNDWDKGM